MSVQVIGNQLMGIQGYLHEVEVKPDTILIFQLPRATNQLSSQYVEGAMRAIKDVLPDGKKAIVVGCDVNIYAIEGMDAAVLVLKGII
jgi:hypothetical protein